MHHKVIDYPQKISPPLSWRAWLALPEPILKLLRSFKDPQHYNLITAGHPRGFNYPLFKNPFQHPVRKMQQLGAGVDDYTVEVIAEIHRLISQMGHYELPLNTSRVIFALLKKINTTHDIVQKGLWIQWLQIASEGNPKKIRQLLHDLQLIELPENIPLRDIQFAWDDRAHDSFNSGESSTLQLILDAYIKGLSALTISYHHELNMDAIRYGQQLGVILDMDIRFALEFSEGPAGERTNYIIYFPKCSSYEDYQQLQNDSELQPLFQQLLVQQGNKNKVLAELIAQFNSKHLPAYNKGWDGFPQECLLANLSFENIAEAISNKSPSRVHLVTALVEKLKTVYQNRLKHIQDQLENSVLDPRSTQAILYDKKLCVRKELSRLDPLHIRKQYFSEEHRDFSTEIPDEDFLKLLRAMHNKDCQVIIARPLSLGLQKTLEIIVKHMPYIKGLEIYNSRDCCLRDPKEIEYFVQVVEAISKRDFLELARLLSSSYDGNTFDQELVSSFIDTLHQNQYFQIIPKFGSDAIEGYPNRPNIGFYDVSQSQKQNAKLTEKNLRLDALRGNPAFVQLNPPPTAYQYVQKTFSVISQTPASSGIYLLGFLKSASIPAMNFWEASKRWPTLRNAALLGGSAVPLLLPDQYHLSAGLTVAWMSLNLVRNIAIDLTANEGLNWRRYRPYHINVSNTCEDIFFTGWAIPLLSAIATHSSAGVTELNFINGAYISLHFWLRDKSAKATKLSALRPFIGWPIAMLSQSASQLFGVSIPLIFFPKLGSELAGYLIEWWDKSCSLIREQVADYSVLYSRVLSSKDLDDQKVSLLDILSMWHYRPKGKEGLEIFLQSDPTIWQKLATYYSRHQETLFRVFDKNGLDPRYVKDIAPPLKAALPVFLETVNAGNNTKSFRKSLRRLLCRFHL